MSVQGRIGRTGRAKVKRALGVQAALEWAFRTEQAQWELPPPKDATEEGYGFGLEYILLQRAALGCKVDGGQHKMGSYTHADAEVIAATVAGMPDSLGSIRMAISVAEMARAGITPNWMPGVVPRCVPMEAKPKRGARRTSLAGSAMVPETLRIIHRPEDVEARLVPGHWEGDLIKGAFNRSAVGTVVERKTRFVILSKMNGCTASAALEGFTRQMKRLPVALRRSMTYDRGSVPLMVCEQTTAGQGMACHPELARRLKIDIWFCDPHAPWQRGSNENTNGLLRQFFPKGTDLSDLSQTTLNDVARMMNKRPRKTLGWNTPAEAMAQELAAFKSTVALQT